MSKLQKYDIGKDMQASSNIGLGGWVDAQVLLQLLPISARTLQRWRTNKVIPYSELGGKYFYNINEVKAQLEKNKIW